MHLNAHCNTIYYNQDTEATINREQIKKMYIHLMEYYSAIKTNETMSFAAIEIIKFKNGISLLSVQNNEKHNLEMIFYSYIHCSIIHSS